MEKKSVRKNPTDLEYRLEDSPPANVLFPLVLQQLVILSSNLIYPVIIVGYIGGPEELARNFVAIMLIATGIGSILQAMRKGALGSGFLCVEETGSMYFPVSIMAIKTGGFSLLFGMTAIAGLFQILLSKVIHRLRFLFPPEVTGLVVAAVGISIIKSGISSFFGVKQDGTQVAYDGTAAMIAFISLAVAVSINIWGKKKMTQYSILASMLAGYIAAYYFGVLTDAQITRIAQAPFLAFPEVTYSGFSFSQEMVLPFFITVICASIKTIGNITTCQKNNDANWKRLDMDTTQGGLMAEGVSNVISGIIGGMGLNSSSGSVGLSIATKATSRRIAFVMGGACIFLALFPKLIAIFAIMPKPVMGSILIINMSFIILSGLQILTSRMMDARKTFIIGISLVFGLGADVLPDLYRSFPEWIQPLVKSSLSITAISAILLNWLFRIGVSDKKTIELELGKDGSESIFTFMETQGRVWGVRPEVIHKAASSICEFVDSADVLGIRSPKIAVTVKFDEFNLDIVIDYEGSIINFNCDRPSAAELLEDDDAQKRLACFLIKSYCDDIKSGEKEGRCFAHFHYDH